MPFVSFEELVAVMHRLRAPGGCPWDREQTFDSLRQYVLEEAYEVVDAIERGDPAKLAEEAGDLLFQVVFLGEIGAERGDFSIAEVISHIHAKLVRRHPHVFGDVVVADSSEVLRNWEAIKDGERRESGGFAARHSVLDDVPRTLPALMRSLKLGKRAARAGFDWRSADAVVDKIAEELDEVRAAGTDLAAGARELGDLLFAAAQLARFLDTDPEQACREAAQRFEARYRHLEEALVDQSRTPADADDDELDRLWRAAKVATGAQAPADGALGETTARAPAASDEAEIGPLEERLALRFEDRVHITQALTHRSRAHEEGDRSASNETMEFLGDTLLGFLVAEMVLELLPGRDEGELTKVKSRVVCEESLAEQARKMDLGRYLRLSRGEDKTGGRDKSSILADTFEAVLAAIYLDQGVDAVRNVVRRELGERVRAMSAPDTPDDPKSALQELCHQRGLGTPRYKLAATQGPDHRLEFEVVCQAGSGTTTRGTGFSKKEAERDAARAALDLIQHGDG